MTVRTDQPTRETGRAVRALRVLFVPDEDHRVYHRGRTLAVFLPDAAPPIARTDPTRNLGQAQVIAFEEANPVVLSATASPESNLFNALLQAAVSQFGVDIEVNFDPPRPDNPLLRRFPPPPELVSVTVPATTHRR